MSPRRKTPEEEDAILTDIETVADDLAKQVGSLQAFLKELKASRNPAALRMVGEQLKELGEKALDQGEAYG